MVYLTRKLDVFLRANVGTYSSTMVRIWVMLDGNMMNTRPGKRLHTELENHHF
jgi:hypothetical protein